MGNRKELVSSLQELREDNIRKQKRGLHLRISTRFLFVATLLSPHGLRGQNECHLSTSVLGNISTSLLALSVYGNISNLSLECIPYF